MVDAFVIYLHGLHLTQSFAGGLEGECSFGDYLLTTGGSQSAGGVSGHGLAGYYSLYSDNNDGYNFWRSGSFGQGGSSMSTDAYGGGKLFLLASDSVVIFISIIFTFVLASCDIIWK